MVNGNPFFCQKFFDLHAIHFHVGKRKTTEESVLFSGISTFRKDGIKDAVCFLSQFPFFPEDLISFSAHDQLCHNFGIKRGGFNTQEMQTVEEPFPEPFRKCGKGHTQTAAQPFGGTADINSLFRKIGIKGMTITVPQCSIDSPGRYACTLLWSQAAGIADHW